MSMWRDMGLCSTNGRVTSDNGLTYDNRRMDKYAGNGKNFNGTSVFNPVLTEVMYKWFTTANSRIFDPFAGGITRGALAAIFGHKYTGCDVNPIQVQDNERLYQQLQKKYIIDGECRWENINCLDYKNDNLYDFIFTCPPYYNLEKYTDLDTDLSNCNSYKDFLSLYTQVIEMCYNVLDNDSFMVWVVSDVRDKKTTEYYGLVADTIKAGQAAGFKFYNEIILYNDTGNLAIVSGDYLNKARKVGRQHQNVLVFYKGDAGHIKEKFGGVG